MRDKCVFSQLLRRIVLLFVVTMLFTRVSVAQTDLQIMVSGPWAYVVDPHPEKDLGQPVQKRIVLAVTAGSGSTMDHHAYIFSGDNASLFRAKPEMGPPGFYYLDIDRSVRTFNGTMSGSDVSPQPLEASVDNAQIGNVLDHPSTPRYAISLPEPDYYTTYKGSYGDGLSQSIVAAQHITANSNTPPGMYTTWMVLHYWTSAAVPAILKDPAGKLTPYAFANNGYALGVSIVMGVPGMGSQSTCDSLSSDSFGKSKNLWNLPLYARFPSETDGIHGVQNIGDFHYDCNEAGTVAVEEAQQEFRKAQDNESATLEYIRGLRSQLDSAGLQPRNADLLPVRSAVAALYFGPVPQDVIQNIDCVEEFLNHKPPSACPNATKQAAQTYLDDIGVIVRKKAAGSTDCHEAQIIVNSAFH